jgi:hypothetical protein
VRSPQLEENHEEKTNYDLLLELADCLVERDETVSQALRRLSNESVIFRVFPSCMRGNLV